MKLIVMLVVLVGSFFPVVFRTVPSHAQWLNSFHSFFLLRWWRDSAHARWAAMLLLLCIYLLSWSAEVWLLGEVYGLPWILLNIAILPAFFVWKPLNTKSREIIRLWYQESPEQALEYADTQLGGLRERSLNALKEQLWKGYFISLIQPLVVYSLLGFAGMIMWLFVQACVNEEEDSISSVSRAILAAVDQITVVLVRLCWLLLLRGSIQEALFESDTTPAGLSNQVMKAQAEAGDDKIPEQQAARAVEFIEHIVRRTVIILLAALAVQVIIIQ